MEVHGYRNPQNPLMMSGGHFLGHGDGFAEYYGMVPLEDGASRPSYSKAHHRSRIERPRSRSKSRSRSRSKSRSRSRNRSHSSRSRPRSRRSSRSRSSSRSQPRSRRSHRSHRKLVLREPSFLDAFRIMYMTSTISSKRKNTTKYLSTKKHQDHITELLKRDGLGSKRWFFYPRTQSERLPTCDDVPGPRDNCDQRVKVDGDFFRKYKKRKQQIDADAPINKLKRWELVLYQKLGFVQSI